MVAVAAAIIWNRSADRRATYDGRTLRDWAAYLNANYEPRGTNAAAVVFKNLGSNAVPVLRTLINERAPFYEKPFLKHARRIPAKPRAYLYRKLQPGRTIEYRLGAIRALGLLETNAVTALPELLTALADSQVRWTAAQTIGRLGPEAVAALIPLTTNENLNLRHAAVYALGEARTNALPATLALIRAATDTNDAVRGSAFYSLSRIGRPALPLATALAVTNSDPELRNSAFRSIIVLSPGGYFSSHLAISTNAPGTRRLAVLALSRSRLTNEFALTLFTNALHDPAPEVREAAELALYRIATGKVRPPSSAP